MLSTEQRKQVLSTEKRKKISEKVKLLNKKGICGWGKFWSNNNKEKIRKRNEKLSKALTGKKQPEDVKKKRGDSIKKFWKTSPDAERIKKVKNEKIRISNVIAMKKRMSEGRFTSPYLLLTEQQKEELRIKSMKTNRKNRKERPEYFRKLAVKGAIASRKAQSSKLKKSSIEVKTEKIINELKFPYKCTGDGKFWIENMNPDFVNVDGQKKVIEVLGSYWHNEKETKNRIETLKKYGYSMLPIWDYELKNIEKVKEKIIKFDKEND